jgi:hypothetical protein
MKIELYAYETPTLEEVTFRGILRGTGRSDCVNGQIDSSNPGDQNPEMPDPEDDPDA